MPAITVCIFAWNEAATIERVVAEMLATLRDLAVAFELLIIDDGSSDGTTEIADRLASEDAGIRVVHHGDNGGLGAVYRTGFAEARGEYVTFFPADGQFPASIVSDFYPRMRDLDLCLGYLRERRDAVGHLLSGVERVLYRALIGPMPKFQGVFMLRRTVLAEIPLVSRGRGWAIVMELVLRVARRRYRVASYPTPLRPRMAGVSKVKNFGAISANFRQLIALRSLLWRDG